MKTPHHFLKQFFGYDAFRPLQEQIINNLLNKKNSLVLMPTGGGKSVCYQIPALMLDGIALIISPLIALMKDQVESLLTNGIPAAFLNSSLSGDEEREITDKCLRGEFKLLYISPEKALTVINSWLPSLPVSLIAIDEAHCISQWGHDFRPEYKKLNLVRQAFPGVPTIALTATADKTTRRDIIQQLDLDQSEVFISSFDRSNLRLDVWNGLNQKRKKDEILKYINKRKGESGIIYCLSRKSTEELAGYLTLHGIESSSYHAGMSSQERSRVQEKFIKDDLKIICATIAFGMGIDKSNIRWIIHYNMPKNMEGYYQEIGRAGRDGMKSDTLLFYNLSDLILLNKFAKESGQPALNIEKLRRMQEYAESRICRRRILLNYFGENYTRNCNNCDVCSHPPNMVDGTVEAQKALSALIRCGEKVGITMLINILRGSHNSDLLSKGYQNIKTYGSGKNISYERWQAHMLQFLQLGLIEIAYDEAHALKVTPAGMNVLQGKESVLIAAYESKVHDDESIESVTSTSGSDKILFEKLRYLRKLIADSEGVAPYHVFTDKTLNEMADQKPASMSAMLSIQGLSSKKFEKYGADFLKVIIANTPPGFSNSNNSIDIALHPDKLREYIKWMEQKNMRISHHTLGKILLGSERESVPDGAEQLPFFGILKNKTKYKTLGPELKQFFTTQIEVKSISESDQYFNSEIFNHLTPSAREQLINAIGILPINRPTENIDNDYIKSQRTTHPRSYEPWNEPEVSLFKEVVSQTNDINFIASTFQRSPESLKAYYKKMFVAKAIKELVK